MRNEGGLAGHLLSIAEFSVSDFRWQEVFRSPHYRGPAECFEDEREAAALLLELAAYFTAAAPVQNADCYFIGSADGPIKIGIASKPEKRLKQLQVAHPHRLELLAVIPGGALQEPVYHERFAAHRLHGEWFARHPDILAEISRLSLPCSEKDR